MFQLVLALVAVGVAGWVVWTFLQDLASGSASHGDAHHHGDDHH